jgi:hypothetical protein
MNVKFSSSSPHKIPSRFFPCYWYRMQQSYGHMTLCQRLSTGCHTTTNTASIFTNHVSVIIFRAHENFCSPERQAVTTYDPSSKHFVKKRVSSHTRDVTSPVSYRGADKSLARPGRKQATATEDFEFNIYPIYNHNLRNISTIYIHFFDWLNLVSGPLGPDAPRSLLTGPLCPES